MGLRVIPPPSNTTDCKTQKGCATPWALGGLRATPKVLEELQSSASRYPKRVPTRHLGTVPAAGDRTKSIAELRRMKNVPPLLRICVRLPQVHREEEDGGDGHQLACSVACVGSPTTKPPLRVAAHVSS